jgi:hypothetical protein
MSGRLITAFVAALFIAGHFGFRCSKGSKVQRFYWNPISKNAGFHGAT